MLKIFCWSILLLVLFAQVPDSYAIREIAEHKTIVRTKSGLMFDNKQKLEENKLYFTNNYVFTVISNDILVLDKPNLNNSNVLMIVPVIKLPLNKPLTTDELDLFITP